MGQSYLGVNMQKDASLWTKFIEITSNINQCFDSLLHADDFIWDFYQCDKM